MEAARFILARRHMITQGQGLTALEHLAISTGEFSQDETP